MELSPSDGTSWPWRSSKYLGFRRRARELAAVALALFSACAALAAAAAPPDTRGKPVKTSRRALGSSGDWDGLVRRVNAWEDVHELEKPAALWESWLVRDDRKSPERTAYAYYSLARLRFMLGDLSAAEASVERATAIAPHEPVYAELQRRLIARKQNRTSESNYTAWRRVGSARELAGSIGALHILVHGKDTDLWSDSSRFRARLDAELSAEWLDARSRNYGVLRRPRFSQRYLELPRGPLWSRTPVPNVATPHKLREAWMEAILLSFQASSFVQLFEREFRDLPFENRLVVFHVNDDGVSFALPEKRLPASGDLERAFIRGSLRHVLNPQRTVHYTHEILHTFGADDLYDKAEDPAIPEREIMNRCGYRLSGCALSPITAYAIGWSWTRPRLTFLSLSETGLDGADPKESIR